MHARANQKVLLGLLGTLLIATPALGLDFCPARLIDREGQPVGYVSLKETPQGLIVHAQAQGLPQGWHGFHLHQTGRCDAPEFQSAGGHFNPTHTEHGFEDAPGYHMGDMPNVYVDHDGHLNTEAFVPGVTLKTGPTALFDADGAALVIHQGPDDYESDPAGAAGPRIACAVLAPPR